MYTSLIPLFLNLHASPFSPSILGSTQMIWFQQQRWPLFSSISCRFNSAKLAVWKLSFNMPGKCYPNEDTAGGVASPVISQACKLNRNGCRRGEILAHYGQGLLVTCVKCSRLEVIQEWMWLTSEISSSVIDMTCNLALRLKRKQGFYT